MDLPLLQSGRALTDDDLVRLFHRTELHRTRHIAEETALEVGMAFANPALADVFDANRILEAFVPEGYTAQQVVAMVGEHFGRVGTRCWAWVMNATVPQAQTMPLAAYLAGQGYTRVMCQVMHLERSPRASAEVKGVQVIPARASYRHARQIAEEAAKEWATPHLADAAMMHLDDPHWDALVAIRDGQAVATASVLAVGDVGLIDDVFVSERCRRQGLGRMMMLRAMEICARSMFKHVVLSTMPENVAAVTLYRELGFRTVGHVGTYRGPGLGKEA